MHARSRTALTAVIALGLTALALPAHAQDAALAPTRSATVAATSTPAATVAPVAGPSLDAATVGVRHREETAAPARRGGSAPGTALMIVGGAAILVGLVIGKGAGDAIAVTGAVIGLVGLYQYLQ